MSFWLFVFAVAGPILIMLLTQLLSRARTTRRRQPSSLPDRADDSPPTTKPATDPDGKGSAHRPAAKPAPSPSPTYSPPPTLSLPDDRSDALDGPGDLSWGEAMDLGEEEDKALPSSPSGDRGLGSSGAPEAEHSAAKPVDQVHISTTSPAAVRPGDRFLVYVFFHLAGIEIEAAEQQVVDRDVAAHPVAAGTRLSVRVAAADPDTFAIDLDEDSCIWQPPSQRLDFRLRARPELADDIYDLRLELWCGEVKIDRWYLEIEVSSAAARQRRSRPVARHRPPRTAFASYSHRDRARVTDMVDALKTIGIDVFLDSLDIRQGADWRMVLEQELLSRDRTLLFWSSAASQSPWVEKEWRFALQHRGLENILPNALEPPEICPAPAELASLQFGSILTKSNDAPR